MDQDLEKFFKDMRKEFGDNAIFKLGDKPINVDVISTGSLSLDVALGVGGIPRGRLTEVSGPQGCGKTTLCLHVIKEAQKLGLNVLYVDAENAVDLNYAKQIGVDSDNIYWNQPSSAEEAIRIIEGALETGKFGLIILDSVAALSPQKEKEDDFESANVALTPRALSKLFRRISFSIRETNTALLFVNQLRDKIGSYFGGTVTPGGHALKYFQSVTLSMRRAEDIKDSKEVIGHTAEINIKKNKVASPFKSAQFDIIYGKGIDPYRDVLEVAKNLGVIIMKGSYYTFDGESLGQGKENSAELLLKNPELYVTIRERCLKGKEQ
jgi:recombination protein RecA